MYKKIFIFDLNGVLLKYSIIDLIKLTLNYPKKWGLIFNFLNPSLAYNALKLVIYEPVVENVVLKLIEEYPELEEHKEFMFSAINCQRLKKGSFEILKNLKKDNCKIYALSNIGEKSMAILKNKYPTFFANFDNIFCTKQMDNYLCKPNKEFYKKHLSEVPPAEKIYFIDDKKENLRTAQELGLHTIQFKNHHQLNKILQRLV